MEIFYRSIKNRAVRAETGLRSDNFNAVRDSVAVVIVKCAASQRVMQGAFVVCELIFAGFAVRFRISAVFALRKADIRFKKLKFLAVFRVIIEVEQLIFIAVDDDITAWHVEMKLLEILNPHENRSPVLKTHAFGYAVAVIVVKCAARQREIQRAFIKSKLMFAEFIPAHIKDNSHHKI